MKIEEIIDKLIKLKVPIMKGETHNTRDKYSLFYNGFRLHIGVNVLETPAVYVNGQYIAHINEKYNKILDDYLTECRTNKILIDKLNTDLNKDLRKRKINNINDKKL